MKKYISPSCKAVSLEPAEMTALSLPRDSTQTTTDGGWSNHKGWNAEDWSAPADEGEE